MPDDPNTETQPITPDPAVQPPTQPEATPTPPPAEKPDWRMVELGQTRRQLEEARTEAQRLKDENERLAQLARAASDRQPPPASQNLDQPPSVPPVAPNEVDFEKRVTERVEQRLVLDRAAQLDESLRKTYPQDYQKVLENFSNIQGSMQLMFNDIMATDDPAYVAYAVGKDPERIQQLRDMLPHRRIAALVKIAMEKPQATPEAGTAPPPARPSAAPPPPSEAPRGGSPTLPAGSIDIYDQRLEFKNYYANDIDKEREADERWFAERVRQKRESVGRPWSIGGPAGRR